MLKEGMYVRCPADQENPMDPRVFICAQIQKVDDFKKTVIVQIYDPFSHLLFFESLPKGQVEYPISAVDHCGFFEDSAVIWGKVICKILSCMKAQDGFFYYYLQKVYDKSIVRVCEKDIFAPFNNGRIDPAIQLKRYEFQNPCWYLGHAVVSKSMNTLTHAIYGFKELAGSKIYLLPHQVNTIMRCLQEQPCRYMLADEVGMGKTIEAISVFKIFMQDRSNLRALIIVPETLKEQWKTELFLKFNIVPGKNRDNNIVEVKAASELKEPGDLHRWDFVIIDEVHRYLDQRDLYHKLHVISQLAENILLLSATPVQQRREEYLGLLKLLQPSKYDTYSTEKFGELVEKQSRIVQQTALILDDLSDFEEEIADQSEEDPHESEDCEELFNEIYDRLREICHELEDEKLTLLFEKVQYTAEDLGVYAIKVAVSYICSNYQIESNMIRNRRKLLETTEDGRSLLPRRELLTISYELDGEKNAYESLTGQHLTSLVLRMGMDRIPVIEKQIKPLLSTFFSSPWAFLSEIQKAENTGLAIDEDLIKSAYRWKDFEENNIVHLQQILDDPEEYEESFSSRLVTVTDYLYNELYDKKVVLFTSYRETFDAYRRALRQIYSSETISFFGEGLSKDEIELNAYRFQNDESCRIMLCDHTGGEGRNFQCADYIIHIDLPWDANQIEQRIGRLDRLERDPARAIVYSVVIYATNTFEEGLFTFWNEGLKIFSQSLSGMEIIMKDINNEIISAIREDFQYGLFDKIPKMIRLAEETRITIRKEQNYDAAGFLYRPMYQKLRRLIDYYNQNENELFANTMQNWASLAGFHGTENKAGILTYTVSSFVAKSAINSQLIPPKWDEYLKQEQNAFINHVQDEYSKSKALKRQERSLRGTFARKLAIENDYLHFFAPGDEIFDCIVGNAIRSCKGRASAFAVPAEINWCGIIFTWSFAPKMDYLLEQKISVRAFGMYQNYFMSDSIMVPISIRNDDSVTDETIRREYLRVIHAGFKQRNIIHLGKRVSAPGFLKAVLKDQPNIRWFRKEYTEENWNDLVTEARKEASDQAISIFKKRSNLRGIREEMERERAARAANAAYFGWKEDDIAKLKETQETILEAMKHPTLVLEAAAFVWMVKGNDE